MNHSSFQGDVFNCHNLAHSISMAGSWLTQLAIVTLNLVLVILFVVRNTDVCGSFFETPVGKSETNAN